MCGAIGDKGAIREGEWIQLLVSTFGEELLCLASHSDKSRPEVRMVCAPGATRSINGTGTMVAGHGELPGDALFAGLSRLDDIAMSLHGFWRSFAFALSPGPRNDRVILATSCEPLHVWTHTDRNVCYFASLESAFRAFVPWGQRPARVPPYSVLDITTGQCRSFAPKSDLVVITRGWCLGSRVLMAIAEEQGLEFRVLDCSGDVPTQGVWALASRAAMDLPGTYKEGGTVWMARPLVPRGTSLREDQLIRDLDVTGDSIYPGAPVRVIEPLRGRSRNWIISEAVRLGVDYSGGSECQQHSRTYGSIHERAERCSDCAETLAVIEDLEAKRKEIRASQGQEPEYQPQEP